MAVRRRRQAKREGWEKERAAGRERLRRGIGSGPQPPEGAGGGGADGLRGQRSRKPPALLAPDPVMRSASEGARNARPRAAGSRPAAQDRREPVAPRTGGR